MNSALLGASGVIDVEDDSTTDGRNRGQDGNVIATKGRNPGRVLAGKGIIKLACGESHVRAV